MIQNARAIITSRLILIPILLLAAFVRFHHIGVHSLWTDEFVSLQLACGRGAVADNFPRDVIVEHPIAPTELRDAYPIWRIYTHAMEQDTHPPLYPMVLRCWIVVFGESEIAARSLSAVMSLLAVWLLYETVRQMNAPVPRGPAVAGWAAALLAAAAAQVEFAQLVRSYSMLIALVLACCWIAARIEIFGATPRRRIALGVFVLLAMLSHYYAAPPLAALGIYLLFRSRASDRWRIVSSFAIAALAWMIIWGPGFWHQREHFSLNMQWILRDRSGLIAHTLIWGGSQPIQFLLEMNHPDISLAIGGVVLLLLPLMALRRRPGVLLWELILVLSIGVVVATDLYRSSRMVEYLRYTAVGSAAICAAPVIFLQAFAKRWWQVLAAVILLMELFNLPAIYDASTPDFRGIADVFASRMDRDDALVIFESPSQPWASGIFYFAATHYAQQMPGQALVLTKAADEPTLAALKSAKRIWIINATGVAADPMVPGIHVSETKSFPPLALVQEGDLQGH
jgi:uncharacterized membrane protein